MSNDEDMPVSGFGAYGRSKVAAESVIRRYLPSHSIILRSALIFGPPSPWKSHLRSSIGWIVESLQEPSGSIALFADEYRTPVSVATVVSAISSCISSTAQSKLQLDSPVCEVLKTSCSAPIIVNVAGKTSMSRFDMGVALSTVLKSHSTKIIFSDKIIKTLLSEEQQQGKRPKHLDMESQRMSNLLGIDAQAFVDEIICIANKF